ncbi:winged helix-turn-helix transcriptional regulator [Polaribacter sp. MSW13]|uniref:Winged helix-turn-helix transcriptional regulator n=1 Tax=Polaribacter marinus TaxID=2916838 RepID=A0A9X1VMW1_9FLAO|nr:winged helix-turn-helix transcriptional regulator [Polaribacter marinus]MCI2228963.1 winged helix-turn-helix transcriptional regulator [Polaribacter marinus]
MYIYNQRIKPYRKHLHAKKTDVIISRKAYYKKSPLKVEYILTKFGEGLIPILKMITEWGVIVTQEKGEFVNK